MAKNYSLKEAVEIMVKGEDTESMNDICRRYPAFACMAIKLGALASEDFVKFASFIPEYVTANKFCKEMKKDNSDEDAEEIEDEETEEVIKEEVVEEKPKKGKTKKETNPYEGMTAVDLFKECKKKGIKAEPKKPAKYYIELLTAPIEEENEEDDWGDEEEALKPAKPAKKPAKKAEPVEDDEDWDI